MKKIFAIVIVLMTATSLLHAQSKPDTAALRPYVGTYLFPEGSVVPQVVISMGANGLLISSAAGESDFNRIAADTFAIVTFEGFAVFKRDEAKKITGITIDARGYLLEGKRAQPSGYLLRQKLPALASVTR